MKHWIQHFSTALKGFLMGAANVIPGVSGGTIAFITGIYEKLIESIQSIDVEALQLFFTGKWRTLFRKVNGGFLLALLVGILIATFSLAQLLKFLLENHAVSLWAFFFGLIVASAIVIVRHIEQWSVISALALVIGTGLAYWVTTLTMVKTPNSLPYLFMTGAIAIATMILPGVSGSYVLVIMDKYTYVINLITGINSGVKKCIEAVLDGKLGAIPGIIADMTLLPLIIFALGAIFGLIGFAKLLNWLLKKYHTITIAFLTGFMVGSLNKIWPWKKTLEWYTGRHGEQKPLVQENILPPEYDGAFWLAVGLALVGFGVVYLIEYLGQQNETAA